MKKRISLTLLALCMAVVVLPGTTQAATEEPQNPITGTYGNLTWEYEQVLDNYGDQQVGGTLTIRGNGGMPDANSSSEVPWGQYQPYISTVTVEDGVTSIGSYAFEGYYNLTELNISNDVTAIGWNAFSFCSSLSSVTIPDSVTTIGNDAFYFCTSLVNVTIQNGVTTIGDHAFSYCPISSVNIPNSVTTIGVGAFSLTELTQVTIPSSVTTVGRSAFADTNITELIIPNTVTNFETGIFDGCNNLAHVVIFADAVALNPSSFEHYLYTGQRMNSSTDQIEAACPLLTSVGPLGSGSSIEIGWDTIPAYAFAGCIGLQTITVPETVKTIGEGAFNTCESLTKITIPNTVTTIGSRAISYCSKLKELNIPASVIRINTGHDGVFGGCSSLETITVDSGNTIYAAQDGALFSKEKATLYCVPQGKSSFTIPTSVATIEAGAFYGCANLTNLTIPTSVTTINYNAFSGCSGLIKLVIPNSVTSSSYNFFGCTALTEVTLPGIANYSGSISAPSLTTITISEGAERLSGTFSNLQTLTTVYLPASLKEIGPNTFVNCSNLTNIIFAGTQEQWNTLMIADGNQELSLATVVCTGTGAESPVDPTDPNAPDTLDMSVTSGGLGKKLTVQVQSRHWLTIQTRRAGSITISSIQVPAGGGSVVTVTFSAPVGSIVQVWETENELMFVNGVPTNTILKTVIKEL